MAVGRQNNGRGQAGDKARLQRAGGQELDPDLETAIEDEMMASGRHSIVPPSGLIGAHERTTGSLLEPGEDGLESGVTLPQGRGADVAPTRKAERREAERHERQSALGVHPAGQEGRLRQEASSDREGLDEAARAADEAVTSYFDAEGAAADLKARARRWVDDHPGWKAAAVSVLALGVGVVVVNALRSRRG